MSESSLLFSLFSGGHTDAVDGLQENLTEREVILRSEIQRLQQAQKALLRQSSRLQTQLERAVAKERDLEATQIAEEIASKRTEADQLRNSRKTLRQVLSSVLYAKSNVTTNNHVKPTIRAIDQINGVMGVREAAHMLPAAMRAGQTLKTVSDQYREASGELYDALQHSDDEDEREAEESATQTMNDAPSAVHTSTNPNLILKYAQEKHSLITRERLSRTAGRHRRAIRPNQVATHQACLTSGSAQQSDLFSVF